MAKLKEGSTIHSGVQRWSEIITVPDIQELAKDYLDDANFKYRKGTFTPYVAGNEIAGKFTYGAQRGQYIAIGDLVFFTIYIWIKTINSKPNGVITVRGLPFKAKSRNAVNIGRIAGIEYGTSTMTVASVAGMKEYCNWVYLYSVDGSTGKFWNLNQSDIFNGFSIVISGSYLK